MISAEYFYAKKNLALHQAERRASPFFMRSPNSHSSRSCSPFRWEPPPPNSEGHSHLWKHYCFQYYYINPILICQSKKLPQSESLRADNRIWTGDLILTKDVLYQLSYISTLHYLQQLYIIHYCCEFVKGFCVYLNIFLYGWNFHWSRSKNYWHKWCIMLQWKCIG